MSKQSCRVWTEASINAFREDRNARLKAEKRPIFESMTAAQRADEIKRDHDDTLQKEEDRLFKIDAWPLGRWPIVTRPSHIDGTLILPSKYNSNRSSAKIQVHKGDDLNMLVHKYYDSTVVSAPSGPSNFVTTDGIMNKRHEYMGPDPRVVSYRVIRSEIHVEWRDEYMGFCWMDQGRWQVDMAWDEQVEAWFVADRNVYL